MKGFFFLIKTSVLTFIFVSFLQIKINQKTLDDYMTRWIKNSILTQPLHTFTQNGILILKRNLNQLKKQIQFKFFNQPTEYPLGKRLEKFKLKRHPVVIENLNQVKEEKKLKKPMIEKKLQKKTTIRETPPKERLSKEKEPIKTKISSSQK